MGIQISAPLGEIRGIDCDVRISAVQNTEFQPSNTYHKNTYCSANVIWYAVGRLNFVRSFFKDGWSRRTELAPMRLVFNFRGRYTDT